MMYNSRMLLLAILTANVCLYPRHATNAGLFLIDMNDQEGAAAGWDVFPSLAQNTTYPLADRSGMGDNDVTFISLDDSFSPNNPAPPRAGAVYDGIDVPQEARDDYLFKTIDTAGTSARLRFDNLDPGPYNITVFEGRQTDPSQFAKIWVGDINGSGEPATENTGNFAQDHSTVPVNIGAGEFLWYRHLEDNTGGLSGMTIRLVPEPGTASLLGLGSLLLLAHVRRR